MWRIPLSLVTLALTAVPLSALTTTHAALAPTGDDLVLAWDSAGYQGGHDWQHGSGMAIDVGQTFVLPRSLDLERITLRVRAESNLAGEWITLRVGTYTDPLDHSLNEVLRVESGRLPLDLPVGVFRYLTLELAEPLSLPGNQQLGFVVGFSGGGGVNDARGEILHLGGDLYPGGQAVADFGAFTDGLTEDLVFFLHEAGGSEPPAPPDPPGEDQVLSLHGDRFRVQVSWRTALGAEGWGTAVEIFDDSGSFWFFDDENLEVFVKVLDGCAINDRYWIFIAGLTNVEVRIELADLQTGTTQSYVNPQGQYFLPIADTTPPGACP